MSTQKKVFDLVKLIPPGTVTTYGHIARKLGLSTPRIVGTMLHTNTDPHRIPCHRVVYADGRLSQGYAFGGVRAQMSRLRREGVCFRNRKVILGNHLFTYSKHHIGGRG